MVFLRSGYRRRKTGAGPPRQQKAVLS